MNRRIALDANVENAAGERTQLLNGGADPGVGTDGGNRAEGAEQ